MVRAWVGVEECNRDIVDGVVDTRDDLFSTR
jgi:hypothetical protein